VLKSLRGRNIVLMATMLLLGQLLATILISLLVISPQARRVAAIVANNVRMVGATLDALHQGLPSDERTRFIARINASGAFRIQPGFGEPPGADGRPTLIETTVLRALAADLRQQDDMVWRGGGQTPLWVRLRLGQQGYYWISVAPSPGWTPNGALFGSVALALALSLAAGLVLQRRINRPLAALSVAVDAMPDTRLVEHLASDAPAEIAEVARSFKAMAARLAAQDANRTLMLAGISHDLKTPLAKIRLALAIDPPQDADTIALLERQLDRMQSMLGQFLDFGRGVDGEQIQNVRVGSAIGAAVAATEADVAVTGSATAKELYVAVRPQSFERALINLIRNAFDHGEPPVSIAIMAEADSIALTIMDSGKGIAEVMLPVVMDPFARGNLSRPSDGGTGLGLAIVARFAREHGGSLVLENRKEGGLAARLWLPTASHHEA
jgi:two-component system, OmpR family, osmolarity sensor histidine kinase EnvZ